MEKEGIHNLIIQQEKNFELPIPIEDSWDWNMKEHIKLSILYKNSQLSTGKDDNKPVKNITRPILNLQYRAEGFDVKDINVFINDSDYYYKSLLVKKFHDKWARENDIDTFIDDLVESYVDFGGVLVKNVNKTYPEVVPLKSIAFCDQTDILSGPIGIKHYYSPDQLMEMEKAGWGNYKYGADATIQDVIDLAQESKQQDKQVRKADTPGKYIEVYEVHGMFENELLTGTESESASSEAYTRQLHIVTFYTDSNGDKQVITLFKGIEHESPFKFLARDKIFGRALGLGGAEELFEPQVWVNYDMIRMKEMLDMASKVLFQTTDSAFANRNQTSDLENGEILVVDDGKQIAQLNTTPVNIALFERSIQEWEAHAKEMGSATGALLGAQQGGGRQSYNAIALLTSQGQAIHDYRKGKLALFVGQIYRDWVLPYFAREITKGNKFLSELELEELQYVADNLVTCVANDAIKEKILNGETIDPNEIETLKQQTRDSFMKGGNKKFLEILKGEFKNISMDIEIVIDNKQRDLTKLADGIQKVFQTVLAAPQVLDDPRMVKILNQALQASGLDPIDFTGGYKQQPQTPQVQPQQVPNQTLQQNPLAGSMPPNVQMAK